MALSINTPVFQKLFRAIDLKTQAALTRGNLITFNYSFWAHDPNPVIIISSILPGNVVKGINLHYLTFYSINNLLSISLQRPFSYSLVKNDAYIRSAFRSYKWQGIKNIKKLDTNFLSAFVNPNPLGRKVFDINEIRAMRASVEQQMNVLLNPPADNISNTPGQ
jgi:hypothetical protein